ncbi:uncharacterized protein LOC119770274 isoform X2 [Culex quinquefasciatus]|uniref:uncharacterized protein LOC119770274 isoform X2 n=1 Tax=Culex quinquefasciatus TaxID=7176 RepID=UPI0018E2CBCF|nr:uncharacterized protein LOC119770274 isoform X2 [Culex quinquefasciatus]
MNAQQIVTCECHLHGGRPVACCGDFVCPLQGKASSSPPRRSSDDREGLGEYVGKSRVRAIRQLFEDKIQVSSANSSRADLRNRSRRSATSSPSLETIRQPIAEEDEEADPQIYRSRTQITHIPNGVKITTTILAGENLDLANGSGLPPPVGEGPSVYETLMYPESEIIKRFELDLNRKGR